LIKQLIVHKAYFDNVDLVEQILQTLGNTVEASNKGMYMAVVTPGAPKLMPHPASNSSGCNDASGNPAALTAPMMPEATKPSPTVLLSLLTIPAFQTCNKFNPIYHNSTSITLQEMRMPFSTVKRMLGKLFNTWQFVSNVDTLIMKDPAGHAYDGSIMYLCKCMN
jgi:hypothetical protein